jgi:hypothetical protein
MKVILHLNDDGTPAITEPEKSYVEKYGIHAIAVKDLPAGKPFKIMDAADLPDAPQEAWVVNEADLTDGVGGESYEF